MSYPRRLLVVATAGVLVVALAAAVLAQSSGSTEPPAGPLSDELILVPVAMGAEGAEAVFVVSQRTRLEIVEFDDPEGILGPPPETPWVEEEELAVRMQLRVLAPDPATGSGRVLVRAQPIDPGTRLPAVETVWEMVYRVSAEEVSKESGHRVPLPYGQYEPLLRPDWLRGWLKTEPTDRPAEPLRPGAEWQGITVIDDSVQLVPEDTEMAVTGRFIGWTEVPVAGGWAAHVEESGSGLVAETRPVGEGLTIQMNASLSGENHVWIVPEDFLYAMVDTLEGEFVTQPFAEPGSSPLGIMRMRMEVERTVEREVGGRLQAETAPLFPEVTIGETVHGSLTDTSLSFVDGTYADYYILHGTEGEQIAIRLASDDFDAYLFLLDENEQALEWDDDGAGGTDALIRVTLPYTGTYYIVANAFFADTGGEYALSVTREPVRTERAAEAAGVAEETAAAPVEEPAAAGSGGTDEAVQLILRAVALLPGLQEPATMSEVELLEVQNVLYQLFQIAWDEMDRRRVEE